MGYGILPSKLLVKEVPETPKTIHTITTAAGCPAKQDDNC